MASPSHSHTHTSHTIHPRPHITAVEVDVALNPGEPPSPIVVPAGSSEEAFRYLYNVGSGLVGSGSRHFYYGSVIEPIRRGYKAELEQLEQAILRRRAALGANPNEYELRGLAQWASRQRARTARVFRIPTPSLLVGLEARDWREYGPGGRTLENLLARNAKRGVTGAAAYERIIGTAVVDNAKVTASIARGARFLRTGGAILGVAGLAVSAYEVIEAPPEQRVDVAKHEAVTIAGGLIGAEVGATLLAVGAGLLAATPPGWIVIGVGLVAGYAGAKIADGVFYPKDHKPVAAQLGAGFALDTRSNFAHLVPVTHHTSTLPIVRQVVVTVRPGDTIQSLWRRADQQAAASVGLSPDAQIAFAEKWSARNVTSRWAAGDPSPENDNRVRQSDIALSVGKRVIVNIDDELRAALENAAAHN